MNTRLKDKNMQQAGKSRSEAIRMKFKWLIAVCVLTASLLLAGIFTLNPVSAIANTQTSGVVSVKTIQNFHSISAYFMYVDLTTEETQFTSSANTALVVRLDNKNTAATTIFSFALNGTTVSGTNAAPTKAYSYNNEKFTKEYSFGSYNSGYLPANSKEGEEYTYIVIPTTNFTNATANTSVTVTKFSFLHRSAGTGAERNKNLNYDIHGVYLCTDFTPESDLNVEGLQRLYTPAGDNFAVRAQNASYTGTDYIEAKYVAPYTPQITAEHGTVVCNRETYDIGDTLEFTITPADGYEFSTLTVNGADVTDQVVEGKYTLANAPETVTVEAQFTVIADCVPQITAENGTVQCSRDAYNVGDTLVFTAKPATGYDFESLTVDGQDVTSNTSYGRYVLENAGRDVAVTATFKKASVFYMEPGAISSVFNTWKGVAYAEWDAVNVQTINGLEEITEYQYIGITTKTIGKSVTPEQYLAVDLQGFDTNWRTYYIEVNGTASLEGKPYYIVDRLGNVTTKTTTSGNLGVITENYRRFNNETINSSLKTEGFFGTAVIPVSNFGDITNIETVSVYSGTKLKAYARFNVGAIRLLDSVSEYVAPILTDEQIIWKPAADNFVSYCKEGADNATEAYAQLRFLQANDWVVNHIDVSSNYESYYVTLPQNMIGSDGYVDLVGLGIKGMVLDVVNLNRTQVKFPIRIAGSTNNSLTDTKESLWQTSIASGYTCKVIYESGMVRTRVPGFLPYDESGSFTGSVYIPFSSQAFINIGAVQGFPAKIQPAMRFLMGESTTEDYKINISGIRFVTDDSPYHTNVITMTGIGGVISGKVGNAVVGTNSNNNVLDGTPVTFTVSANRGYALDYVKYTMNDRTVTAELDANNSFTVEVTGDITVLFNCLEVEYAITYNLDGGENSEYNPSVYYLSSGKVTLFDATKEGSEFVGWKDEEGNFITELDASEMKNRTLTAVWESNKKKGCRGSVENTGIALAVTFGVVAAAAATVAIAKRKGKDEQ